MKHIGLLTVCLLLVAISATAVAAVSVQETFSSGTPTLGGKNQEASNPEHDDEDNFNIYDDGIITLLNNETTSYTLQSITFNPASGFSTIDVNLSKTSTINSIPASGNLALTIKGRISEKLDAVDTDLNEVAFQVATATIVVKNDVTGVLQTITVPIFMQRENVIQFNDAKVETNSKERKNLDDGDNIENLKPGDLLTFEFEVENIADKDSNLEVSNTKLDFTCDDEQDLDINDDDSEQDISEDEIQTFNFDLEFSEDAKDGSIGCTVEADGKDINGARHGTVIDFDLKIERENHDISIRGVTITPQDLTCSDKSFQVAVDMLNLGQSDEDQVGIEIEGRTLTYIKKISNLALDEDDSDTEVFDIPVPTNLAAGTHVLQIRTFYDNTKASDSQIIQVNNLCGAEEEPAEPGTTVQPAISVSKTSFNAEAGSLISIPVKITNTMTGLKTYTISFMNGEDFAQPVNDKTVSLNSGQTSTVFLNVKTKTDATPGEYSATVDVASNGKVVGSETVNVKVEGVTTNNPINTNFVGSTGFWVLIDVLLIVAVIIILWFIFRKRE
ncbi:MAG: hypothetical protein Q7R96_02950 [Nanoarchaeota archaeon]|nr:hypothetical protein [Nanoarchaeota archaeon]